MTVLARLPRLDLIWRPDIVSSTEEIVRTRLVIVNRGGGAARDVAVSVELDEATIFASDGFSIAPGEV